MLDDITVVGEAASGEAAVEMAERHRPDVVVVDLVMPGLGGLGAIRRIRELAPDDGDPRAVELLRARAGSGRARRRGRRLSREVRRRRSRSRDAVRSVARGQGAFSPEITRVLASAPTTAHPSLATLTARELEIAELVAQGRTNAQIGKQLGLSIFTVKNHVSNVLTKLHARTRTEVAATVLNAGKQ